MSLQLIQLKLRVARVGMFDLRPNCPSHLFSLPHPLPPGYPGTDSSSLLSSQLINRD